MTNQEPSRPVRRFLAYLTWVGEPGVTYAETMTDATMRAVCRRARRLARVLVWESVEHGDPPVPHVIVTLSRIVQRASARPVGEYHVEDLATFSVRPTQAAEACRG